MASSLNTLIWGNSSIPATKRKSDNLGGNTPILFDYNNSPDSAALL